MGQNWGSNLIYGVVLPDRVWAKWNSHSEHGRILEEVCEKYGLGALVGSNGDDSNTVEGLAIGISPEQDSGDGIKSAEAVTSVNFGAIEKAKEEFEANFTPEFVDELLPVLNKLITWDEYDHGEFDDYDPDEDEDEEERLPWEPDTTPISREEIVNAKAQLVSIAYYNV